MFSFDIKSGHHHIDISANDQEFLGIAWGFDSKVRYFTVLLFSTSTTDPLVKHLRSKAYRIVIYIDDGLAASP